MASPQVLTLGALLRRYRTAAGLTQEELAEKAGLSVNGISALERGVSRAPRRETIALLAEALGLQAAEQALFERAARQREQPMPMPMPVPHDDGRARSAGYPFVGRVAEVALLDRFLAAEGPPLLLISGEPGIGKTRLLAVAAERAQLAGWEVVRGACYRRGDSEPYAPFPAALLRLLAGRSPARQRLDLRGCAWLARLLPEMTESGMLPAPTWALPPEQERRLMIAAVGRLLANVARPAGTLLLLDDMQWAGDDALALLAALLRGVAEGTESMDGAAPLRVALAYRESDIIPRDALAALIADFAREDVAARLPLSPLAPEEAAALLDALLAQVPGEAERDRVLRLTGGVPYFLVSFARELASEGGEAAHAPTQRGPSSGGQYAPSTVPWSVAASIQQRVTVLTEVAQDMVALVAVAAAHIPRRVLLGAAEALGHDEAQGATAIDEAVRARLLAEAGRDAYACAHDLIREAVMADLAAARRGFLHRLIGEAIERLSEDERAHKGATLAWHFAEAGMPERALPYALLAGAHAAAVYAHAEAERHYRMALDLSQALGDEFQQIAAAEGLGIALGWQDRNDESLRMLEWALAAVLRRQDWAVASGIALALTRPYVDQGRPREGIARVEQVRQALAAHESPPGAVVTIDLALTHLYYGTNQYAEMLDAAERALMTVQPESDERNVRARALWRRGTARLLLARIKEALADLELAAELAPRVGHLPAIMWVWHNTVIAQLHLGDLAAAGEAMAHALEVAETFAAPDFLAAQLSLAAQVAVESGDRTAAHGFAARAERLVPTVGADWALAMAAESRGLVALAAGDLGVAGRALDVALTHAERSGDLQRLRAAQHLLAERDLLAGDPAAAIARLAPLLDRPGLTEIDVNALLPTLAEAHLAAGDSAQAELLIAATCDRLRAQHDRFTLAEALRMRALVALRQRHDTAARDSLNEALGLCDAMGAARVRERVIATWREIAAAEVPAVPRSSAADG